jgi:predicted ATPase/class 3 adenylate cyclase
MPSHEALRLSMSCPNCGTSNDEAKKFCVECGTRLIRACPSCGTVVGDSEKFCGECGTALSGLGAASAAAAVPAAPAGDPAAERRLVSVLFADLVGFTALSESRDAEDVRELLSRYFESCNRLISLYGGTVEKFIGDAVMAVWGTPVATEDDAERAVRAALDLTTAVAALGEELGTSELAARAGVMTGEAAVTLGAEGQGMVAGDLVNTASRVQSLAAPGTVYVGAATRRATDQTVVFEDVGAHELKGKDGLVPLWRAVRVVAGARGSLKSERLEAPFVGRERELRLIKDLFHGSAEEGRAHLVSVTGLAGIGKSRLVWEFFKYFDGLPQVTWWHRGRCLAYGEGVTYWALADMVRMRARIAEDEDPASARTKLRSTLEEHVLDLDERRFIEPKLAQLLGLEQLGTLEREQLFGACRLFFERLAETNPTVMVFEDVQWADQSLLDFIEYLLDSSRNFPLYVLTLGRPELAERRPTWGAGRRNFTSLYLDPLSRDAMQRLLDGLVPGLPPDLQAQILERAEGVPLYAVETARMLLDRGLLVEEDDVYRLTGRVDALDVPETLHALIAARLDGLPDEERRLLQDGAVLGKTFSRAALAAVTGTFEAELEAPLTSLVRKEVLGVQSDPRSPEHGQYGFLQDLVRHVAYETLSKRERLARHLRAAEHLDAAFPDEDEIAEVLASHYVEAFRLATEADDAPRIKAKAREMLVRAGDRAESLAANEEAARYFDRAAELTEDPLERAELLDRSGQMAWKSGAVDRATEHFASAIAEYEAHGEARAAARVARRQAEVEMSSGHLQDAIERMERALAVIGEDEPDEDVIALLTKLASGHWFAGNPTRGKDLIERALELAEALWLPEFISYGLFTKSTLASAEGRAEESIALLNHSLTLALEHDLSDRAAAAYFNLSDHGFRRDRLRDSLEHLNEALTHARRVGERLREWELLGEMTYPLYLLGEWNQSLEVFAEIPQEQIREGGLILSPLTSVLEIYVYRGQIGEARKLLELYARLEASADLQEQACFAGAQAVLARAEGRFADALESGVRAFDSNEYLGFGSQAVKQGFVEAAEAAFALHDLGKVEGLLTRVESLPRGHRPPALEAHGARFRARLPRPGGNADGNFEAAAALFRELEMPFWLAVTLFEHAVWQTTQEEPRNIELQLAEAGEIFRRLEADAWLARLEQASGQHRDGVEALDPA